MRAAPELAVLDLLDHAMEVALLALRSQHPSLDHPTEPAQPKTLRKARVLVRALHALGHDVAAYRAAVVDVVRPTTLADDDYPF